MRSSITLLFALFAQPVVGGCGPLKVFLLDGQSNMVGTYRYSLLTNSPWSTLENRFRC